MDLSELVVWSRIHKNQMGWMNKVKKIWFTVEYLAYITIRFENEVIMNAIWLKIESKIFT